MCSVIMKLVERYINASISKKETNIRMENDEARNTKFTQIPVFCYEWTNENTYIHTETETYIVNTDDKMNFVFYIAL